MRLRSEEFGEWLRDGLEGRSLRATFRLYTFGLLALAAPALATGFLFDSNTVYFVTPILVSALVALEYAAVHLSARPGFHPRRLTDGDPDYPRAGTRNEV